MYAWKTMCEMREPYFCLISPTFHRQLFESKMGMNAVNAVLQLSIASGKPSDIQYCPLGRGPHPDLLVPPQLLQVYLHWQPQSAKPVSAVKHLELNIQGFKQTGLYKWKTENIPAWSSSELFTIFTMQMSREHRIGNSTTL